MRQFIWLMTDTTRFDMLGCYGNPAMRTPNLDALAEGGIRFERAYTAQPVCGPARSALFTGLFPHSNGTWGNCMPLGADVKTLGQYLSAQGIHCGYIGKWHLDGGDYFGNGICPDGWDPDFWYDMKCYLDELTPEERLKSRLPKTMRENGGIKPDFTFAHRCVERAIRFIRENKDRDFFLVLSFDEPHGPSLCPPPFNTMFQGFELPNSPALHDNLASKPPYQSVWATGRNRKDRAHVRAMAPNLLGCNAFADFEFGRFLRLADALTPDAMKMYTSDHGDAIQAHCLYAKGPAVYDEIARIPLIFKGPGITPGTIFPHTVSQIDIPATVMDFFTARLPVIFQGKSLMPVLLHGDNDTCDSRAAFVEFNRYEIDHDGFGGFQPMRAIITDDFKLAIHLLDSDELYDIQHDPYNMHNLIDNPQFASIRDSLHDKIIDWMNSTRDPFRGYQWQCRPWRADKHPSWDVDGFTRQRENDPGQYRQLDYSTGLTMTQATRIKPKA